MPKEPTATSDDKNNGIECGIIMPISQTASHDSSHWTNVQELLHRAVRNSGLEPKNVWAGSSIDRITPRILSNLFAVPIAICDISDLNPNVMLELGMRLTSKKPTIVVAEIGSSIPFDIMDFEVIFYPPNLNILGMESFFQEIEELLQRRIKSYEDGSYSPFLGDITVDFLEPQSRAIPFEKLVESRLDSIITRIERIESNNNPELSQPNLRNATFKYGIFLSPKDGSTTSLSEIQSVINNKTPFQCSVLGNDIRVGFPKTPNETSVQTVGNAVEAAGLSVNIWVV